MGDYSTAQTVLFEGLLDKPVQARFDEPHSSSDGGAILLKAADRRLGLIDRLAGVLVDSRQPSKVRHQFREMLAQRVFGLACGYEDCNDASRIAKDPIFKLVAGRDPERGEALAAQPTLSRFENGLRRADLYRMGRELLHVLCERHRERLRGRARRITIDLDSTDLETFGSQQLALFSGFYGEWCYLPHVGFLTFDDEPEQYAFLALLRPGRAPATQGLIGVLQRTIGRLRACFPTATIRVRLDAGFGGDELLRFLERAGVEYVAGMPGNKVLARKAEPHMKAVRGASRRSRATEARYGSFCYRAKKWSRSRRIIVKAEVVRFEDRDPRDNVRYVVTNLRHSAEEIYVVDYCARGEAENRIKELKQLGIGRMSCSSFWANQLRALLALTAFVLMQELRSHVQRREVARLQVATLRERFLKLAARITSSVRRIVLHLPLHFARQQEWRELAASVGAIGR